MGVEIERKYLVNTQLWKPSSGGTDLRQGYLCRTPERTVRVRIGGDRAWITVKGVTQGISRPEFEYEVPVSDAREMLALCDGPLVEKTRYLEEYEGQTWEVDVFHGANQGLVIAEIELDDPDQAVELPVWVGRDVSGDRRYANSSLSVVPYRIWT